MADIFKSAFDYLSTQTENLRNTVAGSSTSNIFGKNNHELVGTFVEIGGLKLIIRNLLAEGGFALVFSAQDSQSNWYAIKRQIATTREAAANILKEIRFLRQLTSHPNILNYANAAQYKNSSGSTEFLLLTELCSGGSVIDLMKKCKNLSPEQIVKIFYATCNALSYMHSQVPPLIHRDIKIENLLFDKDGFVKLCDFGSATNKQYNPNEDWSSLDRGKLEEEMAQNTTPMYRPPEIMEIYSNYPIGVSMDVWALGCILYYLCFHKHPFEDSSKLAIVNANYSLPSESQYTIFYPLIKACLKPNPMDRPTSDYLKESTITLAKSMGVDLSKPVSGVENYIEQMESVPVGPKQIVTNTETTSSQGSVLSSLKGQGISLFKNLKEKSKDVVQTVQSTYGGKGPDATWVSSRILLIPLPENIPEALKSTVDENIKSYIYQVSQGKNFILYNLGNRTFKCDYKGKSFEAQFPPLNSGVAPSLNYLFELLTDISMYLSRNNNSILVFVGPEVSCILMSAALIIFNKILPTAKVSDITRSLYKSRGYNDDGKRMPLCYTRQLEYIQTIVNCYPDQLRCLIHNHPMSIISIHFSSVPIANRAKTGSRPYVEIYSGITKLWSTFKDYTLLREYNSLNDSSITIDLEDLPILNDVTIVVNHARFNRMTNKITNVFMFSFGFYSSFHDIGKSILEFDIKDFDINKNGEVLLPPDFKTTLSLKIGPVDRGFSIDNSPNFLTYDKSLSSIMNVVKDTQERDYLASTFISTNNNFSQTNVNESNLFEKDVVINTDNTVSESFFDTLSWENDTKQKSIPKRPPPPNIFTNKDNLFDDAEIHERLAGIRVTKEEEADDSENFKFDYEKKEQPKKEEKKLVSESFDLLGLGNEISTTYTSSSQIPNDDPFNVFAITPQMTGNSMAVNYDANDLLNFDSPITFNRNASAPNLEAKDKRDIDPFEDFMAQNSFPTTAMNSNESLSRTATTSKPNYNSAFFSISEQQKINIDSKKPNSSCTFDDLLSSQGFNVQNKNENKTLADMKKDEEKKTMDPIQFKIKNWTSGKERNIRALLASLNSILWEGASAYKQPSMGDLLDPIQVKKCYYKACLVVHPDKQTGTCNEVLAKAIFTELNDAWSAFENGN
ncbi:Numb-associated kinase [Strongyloides ratti]|uniref:Numb-associated kinase n=1 Tax=Strongyloides ratti TaxID=34506 RepID=A0A090N082_STRRB|nr:Numb-associated kinase [Strongyloides ratti]CEF70230.1 Numb-associated kinase [Strongyloides ratti]